MAKILVVDDDAMQLAVRRTLLERLGHQVETATQASVALERVEAAEPSCVLMDLRLPSAEDGLALLRELKRGCPTLPVIVLSGFPADLAGRPEAELASEVFAKPVRTESLLKALQRVATVLLVGWCFFLAAARAQSPATAFEVTNAGSEHVAELTLTATAADWGVAGRQGTLARVRVDGRDAGAVWVFGENRQRVYRLFLPPLAAGSHTLAVERDPQASAPGAGLRVGAVRVRELDATSDEALAVAHAPVLLPRADAVGRFSDVPMLVYYSVMRDAGQRKLEYTVIFSNEDGGTSTRDLMARWGRTTDIEYVYRVWLDARGAPERTLIQTRDHKDIAYQGLRQRFHPVLIPVTDNNMVEPAPELGGTLFRLVPVTSDLARGSREEVMDLHPWTYAVAAKEMAREDKLRAFGAVDGEKISDPRDYLVVEMKLALHDARVQALVHRKGDALWRGSALGLPDDYIERDGWARTTVELPPGTKRDEIDGLAFECGVSWDPRKGREPRSGQCRVEAVGRVFLLDEDFAPGAPLEVQGVPLTLHGGEMAVVTVRP
jgi:CheY-like chemotaxis protein